MPRYSIIYLFLIFSIYWELESVTDPLLDELLKRNGDVYLLVSDSSTDTADICIVLTEVISIVVAMLFRMVHLLKHSYRNMWVLLWINSVM